MNGLTSFKKYESYKDSGVEWIGEIPQAWRLSKLKFEYKFTTGFTPDTKKSEFYTEDLEDGHLWATISDLNEKYLSETKSLITPYAIKSLRPVISKAGSLIYSFKLSVGQVAFINKDMYTNEALATFPSDNSNSVNYLYYAAPIFIVKNANVNIYGAFLLNQDLIKNANVLMPTISEQIQIAEFLDRETAKLDGLISRKQRLIELLKEKRQALITHVVTKGLDPHAKMKDSGVEWIGEIPEGWEVKKLRYLGDAIIGLTYSPNDLTDESENSIFVLRASNIQEGKFAEGDKVFVSKKVPNKLITKKNDLLITSRSGSRDLIGKSILIDDETENYSFGAFMLVFRGKYNSFLSFVLQSQIFKSQLATFFTSTINQLTVSNLYGFETPLPPINEQSLIINHLNNETTKIDNLTQKLQTQITKIQEYRQALITEAVTGKIDVRGM